MTRSRPGELRAFLANVLGLAAEEDLRAVVVVAHPDDEVIAVGGHLAELGDLAIVHATDGAPLDMRDARAHGFATRGAYARARREELRAAMEQAGIGESALLSLGIPDQEAARQLAPLARELASLFEQYGARLVLTHAYEGGHPDHDAVAFAVHAAARLTSERGCAPPAIIDMPLYHAEGGAMVAQRFAPGPDGRDIALPLAPAAFERKRRMLACFVTQQATLSKFSAPMERFRIAPAEDFTRLPNGGELYYERFRWGLDGAGWLALAAAALRELGLAGCP